MGAKQRHAPSLVLEHLVRSRSDDPLCVLGIDEVGTGALAGPVVTAAVAFHDDVSTFPIEVRDSKLLKAKKRKELYDPIIKAAIVVGMGWVTPEEIDKWGMAWARNTAIIRAYRNAKKQYTGEEGKLVAVVDGRNLNDALRKYMGGSAAVFADRADQKSYSVAAASIIAKVTRDDVMIAVDKQWPEYGFANNVGYGTKKHIEAIREHGPTIIHRNSFKPLRKIAKEKEDAIRSKEKK